MQIENITLYTLGQSYQELADLLDREEVTPEEVADTFAAITDAAGEKIDSIVGLYHNVESTAAALDGEIKKLQALKKSKERTQERLKTLVLNYLVLTGQKGAQGNKFTVKRRKNPARVVVGDETLIPSEYIREKVVKSVDKTAIKAAITAGKEVNGATLEQGESVVFG